MSGINILLLTTSHLTESFCRYVFFVPSQIQMHQNASVLNIKVGIKKACENRWEEQSFRISARCQHDANMRFVTTHNGVNSKIFLYISKTDTLFLPYEFQNFSRAYFVLDAIEYLRNIFLLSICSFFSTSPRNSFYSK